MRRPLSFPAQFRQQVVMIELQKTSSRGRFFGRAKGKALRKGQVANFETVLPALRVPLDSNPVDPATLFPDNPREYRIEIGFGGGEHLLHRAAENPDVGYIGCEPFINGMAKMLREIPERGITNIRLHDRDATELLVALKPSSIAGIDILYPDPWPKRRQRKRRFISDECIALMAKALKPGGILRFASDIDDYIGWTLVRMLRSAEFTWLAETADDWRNPYPTWPGTRYEAKAIREGRVPSYLRFQRIGR
jgi:tRNA (guanine-N7-)-methyltransferase